MLTHSLTDVMTVWADKIPGLHELSHEDRDLLINTGALELISLRLAYRYAPILFFAYQFFHMCGLSICTSICTSRSSVSAHTDAHMVTRSWEFFPRHIIEIYVSI